MIDNQIKIQTGTDGNVSNSWTFSGSNGGTITFPDGTIQNTAFNEVGAGAAANAAVTSGHQTLVQV